MLKKNITKNTGVLKTLFLELAVEAEVLAILQAQIAQAVLVRLVAVGQAEALAVVDPQGAGNYSNKTLCFFAESFIFLSRYNIIGIDKLTRYYYYCIIFL